MWVSFYMVEDDRRRLPLWEQMFHMDRTRALWTVHFRTCLKKEGKGSKWDCYLISENVAWQRTNCRSNK